MDRNGNNYRAAEPANGHLSEDDVLLYADGELSREQAAKTEAHLEACWSCRARAEKYEETIRSYVEYCETVQNPMDETPPGGWRKFDRLLEELVIDKGQRSSITRLRDWWASLRPSLPNLSFNPQFAGRLAAPLIIAAVVIVVLLTRSSHVPVVSASELLQRVADAQSATSRAISQPVVHQRLQLRRKTQTNEESVSWETWDDRVNARFVQTCTSCFQPNSIPTRPPVELRTSKFSTGDSLITDLNAVLAGNHMDPQRPLSADSYRSWHSTLQHQQDEVTRAKLSDGVEWLTLRTVATKSPTPGQIAEAEFVVRASDWRPAALRLTVPGKDGNQLYELSASVNEVLTLTQIDPKIFVTPPLVCSGSPPQPELGTRNSKLETISPSPTSPLAPSASADLEVEVLRLLHQAGADLGEQITVKRSEEGPVRVSGIVETNQRKAEILAALNALAGNPAVQIEIETVAEALARQKQKSLVSPQAPSETVEIKSANMPAESLLRAYFEQRGEKSDATVRQFAAATVSQSAQAMQHLGAMKRLINQFSIAQLRNLTPEARTHWLALLGEHAAAFQVRNAALRRELKPVFFSGASDDLPGVPAIRSDEDLIQRVHELFGNGAANDQVIRSAFTVTDEGTRFTAINTPQFWQAMKKAEALAARIGAIARR